MSTPKKCYGLIGKELSHSFSANFFNKKFSNQSIDAQYQNYELANIEEFQEVIKQNTFSGLNVTIPYKEQIIPYLDELSPVAAELQAVNTIVFQQKKIIGYNTDVVGARLSLESLLPSFNGISALILGTGGASKAISYVLTQLGIPFQHVSRKKGDLTYEKLTTTDIRNNQLIINTTPLGTTPNYHLCPDIYYDAIGKEHFLFDLVYNPSTTLFLKNGLKKGAKTMNGYQMLIEQAEASWTLWNQK